MTDTNQNTIKTGSVVELKTDPKGQRQIEMTVVGQTVKPKDVLSTINAMGVAVHESWLLCRWQWDGQFHTNVFNEKELILLRN